MKHHNMGPIHITTDVEWRHNHTIRTFHICWGKYYLRIGW